MANICPICGTKLEGGASFCMNCGAKTNQQAAASISSPVYQSIQPSRARFEVFTPWLIIVGTILIGIGIIFLGMIPGDVYIDTDSFRTSSGDEFHPDIEINSLQIAAILIGIGTILDGLAAGLNVKAYFDLKKQGR